MVKKTVLIGSATKPESPLWTEGSPCNQFQLARQVNTLTTLFSRDENNSSVVRLENKVDSFCSCGNTIIIL